VHNVLHTGAYLTTFAGTEIVLDGALPAPRGAEATQVRRPHRRARPGRPRPPQLGAPPAAAARGAQTTTRTRCASSTPPRHADAPDAVGELLAAASRRAGLDPVRPHQLRHAYGSNLPDTGSDIDVVADLLGHAWVSSSQGYLHPDPSRLRAAVDAVPSPRQQARPGRPGGRRGAGSRGGRVARPACG